MRKAVVLSAALVFLCSLSSLALAQKAPGKPAKKAASSVEVIKGKIVSIDAVKNEIVIRDEKTGADKALSAQPKTISSLKIDEEVKARVKSGTSAAESVKKITRKKAAAKKQGK